MAAGHSVGTTARSSAGGGLAQGQGLIGKPAVEHPHDLGLGLIDDELASGPSWRGR